MLYNIAIHVARYCERLPILNPLIMLIRPSHFYRPVHTADIRARSRYTRPQNETFPFEGQVGCRDMFCTH